MDEIRINVPEGMEIDKENSTFECIKFKPKLNIKRGDFVYVKSKRDTELKFIYKETCSGTLFGWQFFSNGTISEHADTMLCQRSIKIIRRMDDIEYGAAMNAMKKCGLKWNPDTLEVEKISRLPETWEEFCINTHTKDGECYIDTFGFILHRECDCTRKFDTDKNTLPNRKTAEAMLALCQLIQLRDHYNDGWEPDWKDVWKSKYCIVSDGQILRSDEHHTASRVLAFKTAELRDQFLENFRDLIEIAKPLL